MNKLVECATHGSQVAAFVCVHLLATLNDNKARGVVWTTDDDGQVNAYCNDCEDLLNSNGGEWNDDLEQIADIQLICRGCFDQIHDINDYVSAK